MKLFRNKKGAIELSIGTIVIIVIAMSMLILGIVLVRQVMCAGINLTDKVTTETESEITNLFGTSEFGIKCQGEGDQVKIGGGGSRPIACIVNDESGAYYTLDVTEIKLLKGKIGDISAPPEQTIPLADPLIVDKGVTNLRVDAGKKTIEVARLNVPRDIDASTIRITVQEKKGPNPSPQTIKETHVLRIDLVPTGAFTSAIC
jgi:hypothetical protein